MRFTFEVEGNIYTVGSNHDIVIDGCGDAAEHMVAPIPEGGDRRVCRRYLGDLFANLVGKKGKLKLTVEFEEEEKGKL